MRRRDLYSGCRTAPLRALPRPSLAPTASVIMVEPVCRRREVLRDYGSVACTRFPTEVLGAGTYLWVNGFDQRCIGQAMRRLFSPSGTTHLVTFRRPHRVTDPIGLRCGPYELRQ